MEKERIIEILGAWNFWDGDPDTGIARPAYLERLERLEQTGQVVVVTGVRRSGKSTLMKQYIRKKIAGGEDRKNFLYVNLEESKFAGELSLEFMEDAYDAYLEIVAPGRKPRVFLDEVQLVRGWEKFARTLHEKGEATVFASGSSAKLLSAELGAGLTGRHVDLEVLPLTFSEFLAFRGLNVETTLQALSNKTKIKGLLREFLAFGGLPLAVLSRQKQEILGAYLEDILLRDIAARHGIRKVGKLRSLTQFLLTNISSQASLRKASKLFGMSLDTAERYAQYLEDAYLLRFAGKFSYSLKQQEANPKKPFAVDLGLRNVLGLSFSEDIGKLYENSAYNALRAHGEVYYYKDKRECDFVLKQGRKAAQALQVCYRLTPENEEREVGGLLEAMDRLKIKQGTIITEDIERTQKKRGKTIRFSPLWKWLLQTEAAAGGKTRPAR